MKYSILIEKTGRKSFSVHAPDLDCCYAVGATKEEAVAYFQDAVRAYLEQLRAAGRKPPKPTTLVDTIDVTGVA